MNVGVMKDYKLTRLSHTGYINIILFVVCLLLMKSTFGIFYGKKTKPSSLNSHGNGKQGIKGIRDMIPGGQERHR